VYLTTTTWIWNTKTHRGRLVFPNLHVMPIPDRDPSTATTTASLLWARLDHRSAVQQCNTMPSISRRASPQPLDPAYSDSNFSESNLLNEAYRERLYLEHLYWNDPVGFHTLLETSFPNVHYMNNLLEVAQASHHVDPFARPLLQHYHYRSDDHNCSPASASIHQIDSTPRPQYRQPRVVTPLLERGALQVVRAGSPHLLDSMILDEQRVPHVRPTEIGLVFTPTVECSHVRQTMGPTELFGTVGDAVAARRRSMTSCTMTANPQSSHPEACAHRHHQEESQIMNECTVGSGNCTTTCGKCVDSNHPASCACRWEGQSHQRTIYGDHVHVTAAAHHQRDSLDEMPARLFNSEHHIKPKGMPTIQIDDHYVEVGRKICNREDSSDYDNELLALMNEDVMSV
jgi:hypothetical protein